MWAWTKRKGVWGESPLPKFEKLPFHRAKTVSQCTSAGQLTGLKTIGELLSLKKGHRQKMFARQPLTSPKNLPKLRPWVCECTALTLAFCTSDWLPFSLALYTVIYTQVGIDKLPFKNGAADNVLGCQPTHTP